MRLRNTVRNTVWNLIAQIVMVLTGLVIKKVLLLRVGTECNGLNQVLNSIITMISIAELGLSEIIAYYLYEPLASDNRLKVIQLLNFFRKAYYYIGFVVFLVGMIIIPFLQFLVGDTSFSPTYIILAYLLFLMRSVLGYFFSYKVILPYADQKGYIYTIIDIVTTIIYSIFAVFILYKTNNFLYVILLEIVKKMINYFTISQIVNKRYSYVCVKEFEPISKLDIKAIATNMKSSYVSKISATVIDVNDTIVVSMFFGLVVTGTYSYYAMVLNIIKEVLVMMIESAQASIGNLLVKENSQVFSSVINKMTFISFFLASFCCCCLFQLTSPFVSIVFGEDFVMGKVIVLVSVLNIFTLVMQLTMKQFTQAGGLFKSVKKINLLACFMDVILSVIGAKLLGFVGIFLATLVSQIVQFYLRIRITYHEILHMNYKKYLEKILSYSLLFAAEISMVYLLGEFVHFSNPLLEFAAFFMIASMVPLVTNLIIFHSTVNFSYMMEIVKLFLNRKDKQGI